MNVEEVKEFIKSFKSIKKASELYGTEIFINSQYYAFQVNGILIYDMQLQDDVLKLCLSNNRVAEFRIIPDTSIKMEKDYVKIKDRVAESWLMD